MLQWIKGVYEADGGCLLSFWAGRVEECSDIYIYIYNIERVREWEERGDALAIYHLADGPTNGPDKSEKSSDTALQKKK